MHSYFKYDTIFASDLYRIYNCSPCKSHTDRTLNEAFNDYFINIGLKLAAENDHEPLDNCQLTSDSTTQSRISFSFALILVDSVVSTLKNLKASK